MLAARGVSLGLGKINLSELNQLPLADRATMGKMARTKKKRESAPKYVVKKKVDRQTLFAACKAVIFGAIFIAAGFSMTVLGYFDKELATEIIYNSTLQADMNQVDNRKKVFFKSMQYIGPILMGFGAISLIVACKFLSINTLKPKGPAPIAEADSIVDLHLNPHPGPQLPSNPSN